MKQETPDTQASKEMAQASEGGAREMRLAFARLTETCDACHNLFRSLRSEPEGS